MPRTGIPSGLNAALSGPVTALRALLEIEFTAITLRLYSGWPLDVTTMGQTWLGGGFDLVAYDENPAGVQRATVVLPYSDKVLGAPGAEGLFLNNPPDEQPVRLWIYDRASDESYQLLDGELRNGQLEPTGMFVTYNMTGLISERRRTPQGRWGGANWTRTIKPNTYIIWQREKYRLQKGS